MPFEATPFPQYVANFNNYGGERIVTLPDKRSVGEEEVVVATQIVPLSGTTARIDYVLRSEEEGDVHWKAIDIMLDGSIGQVALQRSGFYGLLRDGGVGKLIATLHRKTADLSGGALTRPAANAASGPPG
jgi:ABC-type transporter MlaC component